MKAAPALFRITAIVVFIQLLIGGLYTFGFTGVGIHIVVGLVVFILAIATMVAALVSKPKVKPLQMISVVLVLLVIVQVILGLAALKSGSTALDWVHFVNALLIYGISFSGAFMTIRWEKMPAGSGPAPAANPSS